MLGISSSDGVVQNQADFHRRAFLSSLAALSALGCSDLASARSMASDGPGRDSADGGPIGNEAAGRDLVTYRQGLGTNAKASMWQRVETYTKVGRVVRFDANELVMRVVQDAAQASTKEMRIASNQVIQVDPDWQAPAAAQAELLFRQHKFREYLDALAGFGKVALPEWQQILLFAMQVRAVEGLSGPVLAGEQFLKMAKMSLPDSVLVDLPLCWTAIDPAPELIRRAKKWIEGETELSQLLGASWLLLGTESKMAHEVLGKVKQSKSATLVQLAAAQGWRSVNIPDTKAALPDWLTQRDLMLPSVSLGPTEFIMDRAVRTGQFELALASAARIATLHAQHFHRASRALTAAEQMLARNNRLAEADSVARWNRILEGAG